MGIFQQFPYTNFHEMNLDQLIKIMRQMQDEWAATKAEWASYKDFIDNFFDNLDLQDEVNNKINEMVTNGELMQMLAEFMPFVTPQMYGAYGDGIADDTQAMQQLVQNGGNIYIPDGIYVVKEPLYVTASINGSGYARSEAGSAIIKCDFESTTAGVITITGTSNKTIEINNITIDLNEQPNTAGIYYKPDEKIALTLNNISVINLGDNSNGIYLDSVISSSRAVYGNNITILGKSYKAAHGIYITTMCNDCSLSNIEIMYVKVGLEHRASGLRLSSAHIYCGNEEAKANLDTLNEYVPGTVCINNHGSMMASDLYLDTAYQCFVQRYGAASISNLLIWFDDFMDQSSYIQGTAIRSLTGAWINVDSMLLGGVINNMATLIGDGVTVERLDSSIRTIDTAKPLFTPLMGRNSGARNYEILTGNVAYQCIAIALAAGGFLAGDFNILNNAFNINVKYQYDGTYHFTKTSEGLGTLAVFYKIENGLIYFYVYNRLNTRISVNMNMVSYNTGLVDFNGIREFQAPSQTDNTGLTEIV